MSKSKLKYRYPDGADIFSSFSRPLSVGRKMDPESKVDTSGYLPPEIMIRRMIDAGVRLEASRAEMYDLDLNEDDDGRTDPTRSPGYDQVDAARDLQSIRDRMAEARAATKRKKEESNESKGGDSGQQDPEGSPSGSPDGKSATAPASSPADKPPASSPASGGSPNEPV